SVDAPMGAAWLDVEAHRRDSGGGTYTVTVDNITTKYDADLLLQVSISSPGAAGRSTGVLVKYPAGDVTRYTHFETDGVGGGDINAGFGIGGSETQVTSTYDFREIDTAGNRTLPGITSTNGNIIVTSVRTATTAPFTNVRGIFEGASVGTVGTPAATHIDVLTHGFITLYENSGDLRAGDIKSTANDVLLYAPARIVDATGDTTPPADADVTGTNITMCTGQNLPANFALRTAADSQCGAYGHALGGVGTPDNFLEINGDVLNTVAPGVLRVYDTFTTATLGVFLTETSGDMKIDTVDTTGDTSLVTLAGSIVDARNAGAG